MKRILQQFDGIEWRKGLYGQKVATLVLILSLALGSCSKRLDQPLPTPPFAHNNNTGSAGSIRIMHFSQTGDYTAGLPYLQQGTPAMDLSINDKRLTTFIAAGTYFTGSTLWFAAGKFVYGNSFTIPDSLFDPKGDATAKLYYTYSKDAYPQGDGYTSGSLDSTVLKMTFSLHNNPSQPQDIILYDAWQGVASDPTNFQTIRMQALTTSRSLTPSTRPDHFKIRLINLTGKNFSDPTDQLTLTYADGSLVDPKTTAVAYPGAGDYVELPYGTYQFKVKDQAGNVLAVSGDVLGIGNGPRTYNPGGVFTLVAYRSQFINPDQVTSSYMPSYRLITDVTPSTQPNYIRVQGIHAVPGLSNARFAIDGQSLGDFLSFGQQSGYGIFSIGPHKIQLLDGNGRELASRILNNTYPLDNLSVWAYTVSGQPQLLVTSNDMSGTYFLGDGVSFGTTPIPPMTSYSWQCRFLNLSADIDYASFIDSVGFEKGGTNSINISPAWEHLGIGEVLDNQGVVTDQGGGMGARITAYNSPPGELPGTPLGLVLHHPMVANPQSYPPGKIPAAEPGIYSIALIGSAAGTGNSLQLVTIKHNQ